MLVRVTFVGKGNFNNVSSWLKDVSNLELNTALESIGKQGVTNLARNTPTDTGETANGWEYEIDKSEVSWVNKAHPDAEVNVAKLIELGHGTGTGGYIPPQPYIKKSMDSVFKRASDMVTKEMIR